MNAIITDNMGLERNAPVTNDVGLAGTPGTVPWCEACEDYRSKDELDRLYECQECFEVSAERRCPDCNRFRARYDQMGCPQCGTPVEEAEAVCCGNCEEWMDPELFPDHDCRETVRQHQEAIARDMAKRASCLAEITRKRLRVEVNHLMQDESFMFSDEERANLTDVQRWSHFYEIRVNGIGLGDVMDATAYIDSTHYHGLFGWEFNAYANRIYSIGTGAGARAVTQPTSYVPLGAPPRAALLTRRAGGSGATA